MRQTLARLRRRLATALLAGAIWGSEERLTTTTTDSETGLNQRTMALDATGGLNVVWAEQNGPRGNYQIMTRRRPFGGAWGAVELVVPFRPEGIGNLLGAKFPALVAGAGDSLHLVWHDYRHGGILNCEIYYKATVAGAPWDTSAAGELRLTTSLHPETNGDNGYVPALAIERNGDCHLAWYDFRYNNQAAEILFKSRVDGAWNTTPGDLADANLSMTSGDSQFPAMVVDGRGGLHLVWQDDSAGNWRIYYAYRPAGGGVFEMPIALTSHGLAATAPVVAVDGPGRVTVAWVDAREGTRRLYARHREIDGSWTADRPASPAGYTADEPSLTVDEYARTWLAWHDTRFGATNREIVIQCAAAGVPFDSTGAGDLRLTNGTGASVRPTLLAPGDGTIHVLYRDRRDGNNEIYHREGALVVPVGVPNTIPVSSGRLTAIPNPVEGVTMIEWIGDSGGMAGPGMAGPGMTGHGMAGRDELSGSAELLVVDLFDVTGRRRTSLSVMPGEPLRWQPIDDAGQRLAAGNYWLRPRDGRAMPLKLVVVR